MPAFNPYLPSWEYVPDGEPRVFGDRVYVYGSHDLFGSRVYCEGDYVCWSAPVDDLSDWRYEGVIYRRDQEVIEEVSPWKETAGFHPGDPAGTKLGYLYAPDCVQGPDGRYYLYYSMSGDTTTSVAVSDVPQGPFAFYGHVRHPDGRLYGHVAGDVNCFDPGVLVDEDGRVYLYSGFAPKNEKGYLRMSGTGLKVDGGYGVELARDMLTLVSEQVMTIPGSYLYHGTPFDGHRFFEASSIRKIGGTYYLVWSSELSHELCYATASAPLGPYTWGGILVSIADLGLRGNTRPRSYTGNTHGGMVCVKGRWYIFYHRQTALYPFARQGCAEPIEIAADGSIAQAEVTSCGLNGGPLPGRGVFEARIACDLSSAEGIFDYGLCRPQEGHPYFTQSAPDRTERPDQHIANMTDGSWCGFKYFDLRGVRELRATVRAACGGVLQVSRRQGGEAEARIAVEASDSWATFTAPFRPEDGVTALFFTWRGEAPADFESFELVTEEDL